MHRGAPLLNLTLKLRALDWVVVGLLASEFIFLSVSAYPANSFRFFGSIVVSVLAYFLLRSSVHTRERISAILIALSLVGLYIALSTLARLGTAIEQLAEAGLTDLVAFRAQLVVPVHGWLPGEGFTLLLLLLPIACAPVAYLWRSGRGAAAGVILLLPTLISAALVFSFSRAICAAMVLFPLIAIALMILYRVINRKTGALLTCGAIGWLLLILLCESAWYPNVVGAYSGRHISQIRSTQGRLEIWHRSLALVREHPIAGVGSSNAALFLLSSSTTDETTGFAGRVFSLPMQLLVEKGFPGFLLYCALLFFGGFEFHRTMGTEKRTSALGIETGKRRKHKVLVDKDQLDAAGKAVKCCFAAGIIAVLFRELTYCSLFEHTVTLAMMLALIALACGELSSTS